MPITDITQLKTFGAQIDNSPPSFFATAPVSTLTGAVTAPARPTSPSPTQPGVPGFFIVDFSGAITGNVSLTLPIPSGAAGDYRPNDVVRTRLTSATVAAHTLAVIDGGTGTPTLATMPATLTNTGFIDAQLNAAGTHWLFLAGGGF